MNIEIVKMYFSKEDYAKDFFEGTAHIRLIDFNVNIRGVYFKKRKDFWYVAMPTLAYTHAESGKRHKCPFFSFNDPFQNKQFQTTIKQLIQRELRIRVMHNRKMDLTATKLASTQTSNLS